MKTSALILVLMSLLISGNVLISCTSKPVEKTAAEILGNPNYRAISYGGYRENTRDIQPTVAQLKEDMRILSAMGIRLIRTYNVHLDHASNVLKAIRELKNEDPSFEMYVMLGAWIDAKNAWTDLPDRIRDENSPRNAVEIARAAELANLYPDIVKIIAVGNEAMVHWAWNYYVEPKIILQWVNHLQDLKKKGELPADLWITSSDDYASWGAGDTVYHTDELNKLIEAVDFISMHSYPMHNTHYNPQFWGVPDNERNLSDKEKVDAAMVRARDFFLNQYNHVVKYMKSQGFNKPVHVGESGWATVSNEFYGKGGAQAIDEYKAGVYHRMLRDLTDSLGVTLFYFEAFDEQWKNAANPLGSENHFGLINLKGQAKYALWDLVDQGVFDGLTRDGQPITKTYNGNVDSLMNDVLVPPSSREVNARLEKEKKEAK